MDNQGQAKWAPNKWSVYRQTIPTNNDAEGWHRRLNGRARHAKLNVYRLIQIIHHDARLFPVQVNTGIKLVKTFSIYIHHIVNNIWVAMNNDVFVQELGGSPIIFMRIIAESHYELIITR